MSRTLVVTNDFPTRQGGIESFVYALADRLPVDEVVVYTAAMPGDREFDALLPFRLCATRRRCCCRHLRSRVGLRTCCARRTATRCSSGPPPPWVCWPTGSARPVLGASWG